MSGSGTDSTCPHGRPFTITCAACAHDAELIRRGLAPRLYEGKPLDPPRPLGVRIIDNESARAALKKQLIFSAVEAEMEKAMRKHGPMRTPHEAFGVIYEEFIIEFGAAMHANDRDQQRKEMIQVAAMACRFLFDLGSDNG
jgi:hypothetical protein